MLSLFRPSGLAFVMALLAASAARAAAPQPADLVEQGRRIYVEGVLPSGEPLRGLRLDSVEVAGAQAACITCHRRSGMGGVEGDIQVPPISGRFLFAERGDMALAVMDPRFGKRMNRFHDPYTEESLAAAIRAGTNNSGVAMNPAMPRFGLNDREMKALTAYLRQLSSTWSPGVTAQEIRFATVLTPGIEPQRRELLLGQLAAAFAQKNGSTIVAATSATNPGRRHMVSAAELVLGTERRWVLDVWELRGTADTWATQLDAYYRRQPVFALLSGLSNGAWQPVHDFCNRERVPCWFPSVEAPGEAGAADYTFYFSRGVSLEAEVLAKYLRGRDADKPKRLLQIYRDDHIGHAAALALRKALAGTDIALTDGFVDDASLEATNRAMRDLEPGDAIMVWLGHDDAGALDKMPVPKTARIFFSSRIGAAEPERIPPHWKMAARLVYPYELPDQRQANLAYFRSWLKLRGLPQRDETLQSEVYFATSFLGDTVSQMLDNLYRDYLVERAEDMIVRRETAKAETETRERAMLGTPEQLAKRYPRARRLDGSAALSLEPGQAPALLAVRGGTTVYPRLSLGPGQRFASKGAYIARFGGTSANDIVAESDWITP